MIDWKLNRVLEQTSKVSETTGQSVRPTQANSNGNSNLTQNVNQAIRRGTAGVPGPQLNESTKTWSQMLGRATANSENWTTVSRTKKSNNNSNSNKVDNTEDFNAIKSRRLIITSKAQIVRVSTRGRGSSPRSGTERYTLTTRHRSYQDRDFLGLGHQRGVYISRFGSYR